MKYTKFTTRVLSVLLCVILLLGCITLTASASEDTLSVTFQPNGGDAIDPITVTQGEKYGKLPSSAVTGLSGGDSNWYLVDENGAVTDTKITKLTTVTLIRDHTLFVKREVLAPTLKISLEVPGAISNDYQYYVPGGSQRILTVTVNNQNTDILDYTYQWYKDGAAIEDATQATLTLDGYVSDSGTYKVSVTAKLKDGSEIAVTSDTASAEKEQKVKILHAANTVYYDANGGEGGPSSNYTGGTTAAIATAEPTRAGYIFAGWNTEYDGTGEAYTGGASYTFGEDNGNGGCQITLYAQWTADVQAVYEAYTAVRNALGSNQIGQLKAAADGFTAVLDAFNDLSQEQFETLGSLLGVSAEDSFYQILADWIITNVILETENLYQAYLENPNGETASDFAAYYDAVSEDAAMMEQLQRFIPDIEEVYTEAAVYACAPTISGVEDGGTYYGSATFAVSDTDLDSVTVDGKAVTLTDGAYTIDADNAEHIIVATDKAGNQTRYTVTVYKTYTVTYVADGTIIGTLTVEHGKDATAPQLPAKDGYSAKWDKDGKNITQDTTITAVYTENSEPTDPNPGTNPPTGDDTNILFWTGAMFVSMLCLAALIAEPLKRSRPF